MDTQTCRKCGEDKPMTEYHANRQLNGGHGHVCKVCAASASAAKYAARRDQVSRGVPADGDKACMKCGVVKPLAEYYVHHAMSNGRLNTCKLCHRQGVNERYADVKDTPEEKAKRARYQWLRTLRSLGITESDYDAMLDKQGHRCLICAASEPGRGHGHFPVDHDHATGRVRGLLCHKCNLGVENFRDDPNLLIAASAYLLSNTDVLAVSA